VLRWQISVELTTAYHISSLYRLTVGFHLKLTQDFHPILTRVTGAQKREQVTPFCGNFPKSMGTVPLYGNSKKKPRSCGACNSLVRKNFLVGRAGFEPATNWLKANCSTN
jgi:hypothetical protein